MHKPSRYVIVNGDAILRKDFLKERQKSFTGNKVFKYNRILPHEVNLGDETYNCCISVDKNNAIYDVTMSGFGRLNTLYYLLYGRPYDAKKIDEILKTL